MGNCIQSLQTTFEQARKRREDKKRKIVEGKYDALRNSTSQQAEAEERRFMRIAENLAKYAQGINELENNTELPEHVRLAKKRILLAKQRAANEQMTRVGKDLNLQIRKQAQIEVMESLLDEKKKGDEFTKLVAEIPAFDTKGLEKTRDKVNDALEDLEETAQDKLDSTELSAFTDDIETELKVSESRQKKAIAGPSRQQQQRSTALTTWKTPSVTTTNKKLAASSSAAATGIKHKSVPPRVSQSNDSTGALLIE